MQYELNGFAEKFIINRFLPDNETFNKLSDFIYNKKREINGELKNLNEQITSRPELAKIMQDWLIFSDLDKIAAAKMYKLYRDVRRSCDNQARMHIERDYEVFITESSKVEGMTAHVVLVV